MNIEKMFDLLAEDLSREYSHWNFYIQSATSITGLHREEIGEFLLEQAKEEMVHVEEFKKMLHGLNVKRNLNKNIPTKIAEFKNNISDPVEILNEALKMEDEVVKNYVQRIEDASLLQEIGNVDDVVDGKYIELFLEDQILDSRKDADHIRMMLLNKSI
jgi:ferritin